jgi:hypothetical protein
MAMKTNGRVSGNMNQTPAFALRAQRALRRAGKKLQTQNRALKLPLLVWKDKKAIPKKEIVAAIKNKCVLRFVYNGEERIVEPQTYGVSRAGKEILRARQIGGGGQSGEARIAKLFDMEKISRLKTTGNHFTQTLPAHNPNDSAMMKIFATLPKPGVN